MNKLWKKPEIRFNSTFQTYPVVQSGMNLSKYIKILMYIIFSNCFTGFEGDSPIKIHVQSTFH